jgi:hypothetical protein
LRVSTSFSLPLFSFKTDAAGVAALAAFECAALVVSRSSAPVRLKADIAIRQRNNMELPITKFMQELLGAGKE